MGLMLLHAPYSSIVPPERPSSDCVPLRVEGGKNTRTGLHGFDNT